MKRLLSVFLALALCISLTGTAFAADSEQTEYEYNFVPVGVDADLYKTPSSMYTSYGSTKLNTDWLYLDGSITSSATPNLIIFNGLNLDGYGSGDWQALKLRVPKAGVYSFDYFYYTASSYNSGEIYLASKNTASADYFDSNNFLTTVEYNATSEAEKNINISNKVLAVNEDNQEVIFIMKRKKTAPNVARKIVLTKIDKTEISDFEPVTLQKNETYDITLPVDLLAASDAVVYTSNDTTVAEVDSTGRITAKKLGSTTVTAQIGGIEKEIQVTVEQSYTYNFLPAEYGTEGSEGYVNIYSAMPIKEVSDYSSEGLNWKYHSMHADLETAYNKHDEPRKLAGIIPGYGLKVTPSESTEQWVAIKFRVPDTGVYSVNYTIGAADGYSANGMFYLLPGDAAVTIDDKYLSLKKTNFQTTTETEHAGINNLTVCDENEEFILVLYPNANAPVAITEMKLTKVSDVRTAKVYLTAPSGVALTDVSGTTQGSQLDKAVGTEIAATAPAKTDDGKVFKYWQNLSDGSVYSVDKTVSFRLASNTSLMAVYADSASGYLVEFANANRAIVKSEYLQSGDTITAPDLPSLTGFGAASGWSAYPETVGAADVQSIAQYGTAADVAITVVGGTADKEAYKYNDKVTVTASDTASFKYWKRGARIVSYDSTYSFHAWNDATLTAVSEGEISGLPSVILDDSVRTDGEADAYMMELVGFTANEEVLEYGILFGGEELDLTKDTVYKASAVTKSSNQFSAMVPSGSFESLSARAYAVYLSNGIIRIAYSDVK